MNWRRSQRRRNRPGTPPANDTGAAKSGKIVKRGWKIALGAASVLVLLLGAAAIFVYLNVQQNLGVELGGKQNSLSSLQSLPYVAWTEEDVDRSKSGVVKHDQSKAFAGYNIYTNDVDQVFIMDMQGQRVHSWKLPGKFHCEFAELLDEGQILVICEAQAIIKLDWLGNVLWESSGKVNHDVAVLPDGSLLVPVREQRRPYKAVEAVIFDSIAHLSADGKLLDVWSSYGQLEALQKHHPPLALDNSVRKVDEKSKRRTYEYYHLNTVEVLPDSPLGKRDKRFQAGNILLSLRNANLIVILDRDSWNIEWSWGPGFLDFPHMPTMIENGNLLIFDNGPHRTFSRVIELDPLSREIVWEFQAKPPTAFYSKWRGSNQRLANGNTLICNSENGRVFEVTTEGEVVWDFWNPEIRNGKRKRIYRMMRLAKDEVEPYLGG